MLLTRFLAGDRAYNYNSSTGFLWQQPQNPVPGSFEACAGGLQGTGFTKGAADLINQISGDEGSTSRDLLAVTWMNESHFDLHSGAMDNGHPEDVMQWDVGPFQINVHWTLAQVAAKEVSFGGLNERNVFGYNFYRSDGKDRSCLYWRSALEWSHGCAYQKLNPADKSWKFVVLTVNLAGHESCPIVGSFYVALVLPNSNKYAD
jgi:hypothetical protein